MGLFQFWKKPGKINIDAVIQDAVKNELAKTLNWASFFSGGGEGKSASGDKSAYKSVASVYKAIKAIIDNAPQAKVVFLNQAGEMVESRDLQERFKEPSVGKSYNDFIGELAGNYQIFGEVFILIDFETIGSSIGVRLPSLKVIDPSRVTEDISNGNLVGWIIDNKKYLPEEIIQIKDFNPFKPHRGLSPLEPISKEISIDAQTMIFNDSFFKNDATPHLILEADKSLTEIQRKQISAWWQAKHQGANKAGTMAILEGGMKARTLAPTHKDMDFIEQKKMTREEILGNYRCPKALFNITDTLNYATFNGQMKVFWLYTIVPMLRKVEDGINMGYMKKYAKGLTFAFDYRNVPAFAEDFQQKVVSAKTLWDMGFTRNEINEELELGFLPKPWGEDWWVGQGLMPARMVEDWMMGENEEDDEEDKSGDEIDNAFEKHFPTDKAEKTFLKSFARSQVQLEIKLYKRMRRYFNDIRRQVISLPDAMLSTGKMDINWEEADKKLKWSVEPTLKECIEAGIDNAEKRVGKGIEPDTIAEQSLSYLNLKVDKLVLANRTLKKFLEKKVKADIVPLITDGATMSQIATAVRDSAKDFFNIIGNRAKLIARTETVGAINGGSMIYYREQGCSVKKWVTAMDEYVRESHRHCQSAGWIDIDKTFPNGLDSPGDQSTNEPGEVCNCRCTIVADYK